MAYRSAKLAFFMNPAPWWPEWNVKTWGKVVYLTITSLKLEISSFIHSKWLRHRHTHTRTHSTAERKRADAHFTLRSFEFLSVIITPWSSRFLFWELLWNTTFATVAAAHWKGITSVLIWIYNFFYYFISNSKRGKKREEIKQRHL